MLYLQKCTGTNTSRVLRHKVERRVTHDSDNNDKEEEGKLQQEYERLEEDVFSGIVRRRGRSRSDARDAVPQLRFPKSSSPAPPFPLSQYTARPAHECHGKAVGYVAMRSLLEHECTMPHPHAREQKSAVLKFANLLCIVPTMMNTPRA